MLNVQQILHDWELAETRYGAEELHQVVRERVEAHLRRDIGALADVIVEEVRDESIPGFRVRGSAPVWQTELEGLVKAFELGEYDGHSFHERLLHARRLLTKYRDKVPW